MTLPWVDDGNAALLTDLYELTMLDSYFELGMNDIAAFDLFVRRLPPSRNYLVACGLEHFLRYLENFSFSPEGLFYLESLGQFSKAFIDSLRTFRFTGDVYAVPEGTVVFANETILEVVAPLPQAQVVETFVMNQVHLATMAASKAARSLTAGKGRSIIDFGLRRMHGADAGMKAARAFYIAGAAATSNVLAGEAYGIPVSGTMAHSYIQAFDDELDAFRRFAAAYPNAVLLVDTYDTLGGVRRVIELAKELGSNFRVSGIRLDSGDLAQLSQQARRLIDDAGLQNVRIFASGDLDEYEIERLVSLGAPIDGFGVGSRMGVSSDAPALDIAYKLVEYAGRGRMKLSQNKATLPGRKQVFRHTRNGRFSDDTIALASELIDGEPLLLKAMENGRRLRPPESLEDCRSRRKTQIESLPGNLLELQPADPPYPVKLSSGVMALRDAEMRR